jgi:hypothetical protein
MKEYNYDRDQVKYFTCNNHSFACCLLVLVDEQQSTYIKIAEGDEIPKTLQGNSYKVFIGFERKGREN